MPDPATPKTAAEHAKDAAASAAAASTYARAAAASAASAEASAAEAVAAAAKVPPVAVPGTEYPKMMTEEVDIDDPKHKGKKIKRTVPKHFPEGHPKAGELMIFQSKKDEEESGKGKSTLSSPRPGPAVFPPDPVYPLPDRGDH